MLCTHYAKEDAGQDEGAEESPDGAGLDEASPAATDAVAPTPARRPGAVVALVVPRVGSNPHI